MHGRARGWRGARALSGGRTQVGTECAPAVRRGGVHRHQGRGADRAGGDRWVGKGDAKRRQVHLPAQGAHRSRSADRAAGRATWRADPADRLQATLRTAPRRAPALVRPGDGARALGVPGQPLSRAPSAAASAGGSSTPHSSRAECIESWGTPTSTVAMPSLVAVSGPIVLPQGMLLRDTKSWKSTPARWHAPRNNAAVSDDVA